MLLWAAGEYKMKGQWRRAGQKAEFRTIGGESLWEGAKQFILMQRDLHFFQTCVHAAVYRHILEKNETYYTFWC